MNSADYLIIAAILISAAIGAARGFLREAISLGAWVVALFVAPFSEGLMPVACSSEQSVREEQPWPWR